MLGNLEGISKQERAQIIEKVAKYGDIQKLCDVFGVSRSGFYAYVKRKRFDRDAKAMNQVLQIYQRYEGNMVIDNSSWFFGKIKGFGRTTKRCSA